LNLVVYAHPYPMRSRGCAALVAGVRDIPGLELRTLYQIYPDFDLDAATEYNALLQARRIVWLAPLYWYSVPALLHLWFEKVLTAALVDSASAELLRGKECLWAVTTGGGEYRPGGRHDHAFEAFVPPIEMTARYCGMRWAPPFVVHDPDELSDETLVERGRELRERLMAPVA
jgi:glutathione-regulated potassium-efflux system ancillary protein KefF